ncbi:MAG: 4a-hydroxytetrahydrobiopterin dehydratase [bacterium]|jgi:4a-hydroxytetrahydrobiopterin dehydratase
MLLKRGFMNALAKKKCIPCKGGIPPLKGEQLFKIYQELKNDWKLVEEHQIEKEFQFPDFKKALEFTNSIGSLAEEVWHHPDIHLSWGKVIVMIWTHKINGLAESDFIYAAKVDQIFENSFSSS